MKHNRREHGHVIAVDTEKQGDTLTEDTAAGATTIPVSDVCDFDESGGTVQIDGALYAYSTCDDDASTITLTAPLGADADAFEPIYVWDTQRLSVVVEYVAQVHVDGDEEGDPVEASVAAHLIKELPSGIRSLVGEAVLLEVDHEDDEWRVIDVLGIDRDALGTKFMQDAFTIGAPGTQDVSLTYDPIVNSEHLYWNGLYQPQGTVWSRVERAVTIDDTDEFLAAGDVITVEYAYLDGGAQIPAEAGDVGDPSDLAVQVWYSPEYEASIHADGVELDTITDLSGNDNHATCGTVGSSKPRIYHTGGPGGGPRIRFANGAYASLPSGLMVGAAAGEIMAMVQSDHPAESGNFQGWWKFGTNTDSSHYPYQLFIYDDFGCTVRRGPLEPEVDITTWHRTNVWSAADDWAMQQDGVTLIAGDAIVTSTVSWATVAKIGNGKHGTPDSDAVHTVEIDFGAIVLKRAKHSTSERAELTAWMEAHPSGGMP